MRFFPHLILAVLVSFSAWARAQTQSLPQSSVGGASSLNANSGDVGTLLTRIDQETQRLNADVGKLRVDRWKADSSTKRQANENAVSIQRNITAALPELLAAVRTAPQSLAANFKLYRNLNALYDVVANLAESTGAFGKREEYDLIAPHVSALDDTRRSYADLMQQMSAGADERLVAAQRAQAAAAAAAAAAAQQPPKKIIVDDTEPSSTAKKKKTKKTTKAAASSSSTGASTPQ